MFDGHRSVLPSPDHLFFMGLTRCVVWAVYAILPVNKRLAAEVSLRDALSKARLQRTRVYNLDKGKTYTGNTITEWAAVLAVAPCAFRRILSADTMSMAMQVVVEVLTKLQSLVEAIYAYPRIDIDGADACRARLTNTELMAVADDFMSAVSAACLRPDCVELAKLIDVPNLHRLREVVGFSIPALSHVRHSVELSFESSHQPLKRAMVQGNGHDDAKRAMMRVVEEELVSRLRLDPSYFGIPKEWTAHPGVQEALKKAMPLWSEESTSWRLAGATVPVADVPEQARERAAAYMRSDATPRWRQRSTRGDDAWVGVGDTVGVLVTSEARSRRAFVDHSRELGAANTVVAYFRVMAFCSSGHGPPFAIVNPYGSPDKNGTRSIRFSRFQYLPLVPSMRRALVVHDCDTCQPNEQRRMAHTAVNRWVILQRPRSG